jgi:alpha-L-fucosidase 2
MRISRLVLLVAFASGGLAVVRGEPGLRLWYAQPATKWTEALPLGNGLMGAMVFGGIVDERIQFNEGTLWTGKPHDYVRAGAGEQLSELRRLVAAGNIKEAHALAKAKFLSDPVRQKAFQPFGNLRLKFAGHEGATGYRRELNLETATSRVSYRVGDVEYRREAFASYPDRVVVLQLTASAAGKISLSLKTDSPHPQSVTRTIGNDTLALSGAVAVDGLRFESRGRVIAEGGRVRAEGEGLAVEGADSVTLLLVAATSFVNFQDISGDPSARCAAEQAALARRSFTDLRAAQQTDYRGLFSRVSLDLGRSQRAELATDVRLAQVKAKGLAGDPDMAALYFHYGRYLLIASSRAGGRPANLQGIWNDLLDPPWESKWTTNINVEMNYWPAELLNLSECHEPLFDLIDDAVVSGRRTARAQYGARGWVLHHNTDLWRGTAPINNVDGVWPTGGAWLCQHLWERWLFTGDRVFLEKRAYPAMKAASEFFVDFLVKDAATGWLVSTPSYSPEQGTLTVGPTMDHQIIRALLSHTIEAAGALRVDRDFAAKLTAMRAQLAPDQVGQHGQLQEWLTDSDVPKNNHRHMSPLWALYPGADITPAEPKLFAAAKVLLAWRGGGSTGWSYAWRIPLWARVGDEEFAYGQLAEMLAKKTLPNGFDLCGPFQIDGNFGAPAGMAEMLLQSHTVTAEAARAPQIDLLPALPKAWATGSVTGLCARGGFEVDLTWAGGVLTQAVIRAKSGSAAVLRYAGRELAIHLKAGQRLVVEGSLKPLAVR